jgi:hypothetical protein
MGWGNKQGEKGETREYWRLKRIKV